MPTLVELYERSIFKDLPGNVSKLESRHPIDPSATPLKHIETHTTQDDIHKNVAGLNLTLFTPPTVANPDGVLTFSRHAVGDDPSNLAHVPNHSVFDKITQIPILPVFQPPIPGNLLGVNLRPSVHESPSYPSQHFTIEDDPKKLHNKLGFANINTQHYEGIGKLPIITHGGSFFIQGAYNPQATLDSKIRSIHLRLKGKNVSVAGISFNDNIQKVTIFQKRDINTIEQNLFINRNISFHPPFSGNLLGVNLRPSVHESPSDPSQHFTIEDDPKKLHNKLGFANINTQHYEGSADHLPIETRFGKFSLTLPYNPLDVLHAPKDSLHLNLAGNRNLATGNILGETRKFSIFQLKDINITNPLTHEILEANSGLFKLKGYDPLATRNLKDQLHGIEDPLKRRPEIEERYKIRQGFNLPDSNKAEGRVRNPDQPGGLITLPLPTLQVYKPLINVGDPKKGIFNSTLGIYDIKQIGGQRRTGDIYRNTQPFGVGSNRTGRLSQPFFETKLQGDPAENRGLLGSLGTAVEHAAIGVERTAKFLITANGIKFAATQFFLQSLNPTLETKTWNPTSLFSTDTGVGNLYIDRHANTSFVGSLINAIPGLSDPFPGAHTYEESLIKTGGSRVAFQVPHVDETLESETLTKINFANKGVGILVKGFKDHNPNKYNWPIGSDGAGLPFSSRIGPFTDLNRNKKLISQGEKYTKSIGFNSRENTPKSILDSVLGAIPGVNAIANIISGIRGVTGISSKIGFKYVNIHNLSRPYTKGNEIRGNGDLIFSNAEVKDDIPSKGNLEQFAAIRSIGFQSGKLTGTPLINILDKVATIGETNRGADTTKPAYTFLRKDELRKKLGIGEAFIPEKKNGKEIIDDLGRFIAQNKPNLTIHSYLQTYGEIGKRSKTLLEGNMVDKPTDLNYEAFLVKQKTRGTKGPSTMRVNLGFAGKNNVFVPEKSGFDRINALDINELPEEQTPFLRELIPFRFFHITENRWIVFRAYLSGITENNSANWNEKRYIGRADPVYTYIGATRKLNFNFDIHPESAKELKPLWKKINAVTALCWPKYIDLPRSGGKNASLGQYMVGPFVRLTIGDMYNQVPGLVNSVTIVVDDTGTWEDRRGKVGKDDESFVAQLPKYIRITVDFTIIGKEIFDSDAKFFDFNSGFREQNQRDLAISGREILDLNNQPDSANEKVAEENLEPRTDSSITHNFLEAGVKDRRLVGL